MGNANASGNEGMAEDTNVKTAGGLTMHEHSENVERLNLLPDYSEKLSRVFSGEDEFVWTTETGDLRESPRCTHGWHLETKTHECECRLQPRHLGRHCCQWCGYYAEAERM